MYEKEAQSQASKKYKSPIRTLMRCFEKSRGQWKKKCQDAKYKIKLLQNKIRYMENNKIKYKKKVKELEAELQQMRNNEKILMEEIKEFKKNFYL